MRECNKLWFVYYFFSCTSLCGQRSAKKPTSIACWTASLFLPSRGTMCSHKKSLAKKLYNLFGLVVLALVTAFGSWFKVREFDVLWPLRLPEINDEGKPAISKSEANIENFSEWVAGTMVPRVRKRILFCETNSTPQEPFCTPRNERKNSTWAKITNCSISVFNQK